MFTSGKFTLIFSNTDMGNCSHFDNALPIAKELFAALLGFLCFFVLFMNYSSANFYPKANKHTLLNLQIDSTEVIKNEVKQVDRQNITLQT
jgi:hypothetical protein